MYNTSFRARGRLLRFDASGNVHMDYDLKLWVWQDPTPELRTVGAFDGRLKLWHSQLSWHTPGNQVRAPGRTAPEAQQHSARNELGSAWGGGREWGTTPRSGRVHPAEHGLSPKAPCQPPVSQCSRQCREGQVRRVKGFHSCCYDCVDCKAGSYQRSPGEHLSEAYTGWE